jgi:4-amino-4-deoxychorismate lyase
MYLYLNGRVVNEQEATISIFDHGYLYGIGLFETFRTYGGVPFLLADHLNRLQQACEHIGIEWQADQARIEAMVAHLLEVNQLADGYFRFNLSAGAAPIGLPTARYSQATEALFVKELPHSSTEKNLYTLQLRRNTPEGPIRYKSHHYLNNLLGKKEAPEDSEGIFLTEAGMLAEGVVSNLFFVYEEKLCTPQLSTGILNGITRQWVLKAAKQLQIEVEEGFYEHAFAQQADEVFVTNAIQEIKAVACWDDVMYPSRENGITQRLQQAYQACVGKSGPLEQIMQWLRN